MRLAGSLWLGDKDIWEEISGAVSTRFQNSQVKFLQINTIYLDSNLPFKNSLGLMLQEMKLISSWVFLAWPSNHDPKLPNWLKYLIFHQQRQNNVVFGPAGSFCQKKRILGNCNSRINQNSALNLNVENHELSTSCATANIFDY